MNEHDVEQALRDWIEEDASVPEPSRLRQSVMAVPETAGQDSRLGWSWLAGWLRLRPPAAAMAVGIVLVVFAIALDPFGSNTEPGTLSVAQDGSGEYTTIGDAVAAARDGDTILLAPGTYVESIHIDKDISLRGDGERDEIVITSPADEPLYLPREQQPYAIRVEDADVSIADLTLTGPTSALISLGGSHSITNVAFVGIGSHDKADPDSITRFTGLILADGSTAQVRDSLFREASVIVDPGAGATLEANEFETSWVSVGTGRTAVAAEADLEPAVLETGGSDHRRTVIEGNVWTGSADAIFLGIGETALVEGNEIRGGGAIAIMVMGAREGSVIRGNTISDNRTAIMIVDDTRVDVSENEVSGNEIGLNISGRGATVRHNEIRDNTVGVIIASIVRGTSPTLEGNTIEGNVRGLSVSGGASPLLRDNVICDNELNLSLAEGAQPVFEDNEICPDGASSEAP